MNIALYAGSFDPITNGHLDIIKQASNIFDEVIVAVAYNPEKKSFLDVEIRLDLIRKATSEIKNIVVDSYDGLTVAYAVQHNAFTLIRGIRNSKDFEFETELATINKSLNNTVNTIFLIPKPENKMISSSAVREILANKGDISEFVPNVVKQYFTYQ